MNGKQLLVKADRVCAWALVAVMVIFFISGYGITKEVIPPVFSKLLHDELLPIPGAIAIAFHSAYGMHIAFKRWKIWSPAWKWVLIVYAVFLVAGTVVFQFAIRDAGATVEPTTIEL